MWVDFLNMEITGNFISLKFELNEIITENKIEKIINKALESKNTMARLNLWEDESNFSLYDDIVKREILKILGLELFYKDERIF